MKSFIEGEHVNAIHGHGKSCAINISRLRGLKRTTINLSGDLPITLKGQHVRLEPLTQAHAEPLIAAAWDGELWNTQVTIIPEPVGMNDYIQAAFDGQTRGRELPFVIVHKSSSEIAGATRCYEIRPPDRAAAIGYTIWRSS